MDCREEIYRRLDESMPKEIFFLKEEAPFRYLVTVMLSGHSTDKMAELSASRLFSIFPDERAVAEAPLEEIEDLIRSSGLARTKAGSIRKVAQAFLEGGLPQNREDLESLPGVGEKTASCYLSRILGEPAVVVDTHFSRVAFRLGLTSGTEPSRSAREIRESFSPEKWNRLSDVVNAHGRQFCRPKPLCGECILSDVCPRKGL